MNLGTFGWAIEEMKHGERVMRPLWNGKGMYLEIQDPDPGSTMGQPYIYIKPVDGRMCPWHPTQADMLGEDWEHYQ